MKRICLYLLVFCLGVIPASAQELKGPTQIVPGTLAVFEISPPQVASWIITPFDSGNTVFAIDSGSARIYFATPNKGTYTIVAAIITDERPHQLTASLINDSGEPDPPTPEPTPVPDNDLTQWLAKEIPLLVKSKNIDEERKLISACFKRISESIDQGVIQTASNARTQLQISLTGTLAKASSTAVTDWQEFLAALSKKMEEKLGDKIDSLPDLKNLLIELSRLLEAPLKDIPPQTEGNAVSESVSPQSTDTAVPLPAVSAPGTSSSPCADGHCTVPSAVYRLRRQ